MDTVQATPADELGTDTRREWALEPEDCRVVRRLKGESMDAYLVKLVRTNTDVVRVKATDAKNAKSRALRGIGKRISTTETNVFAKIVAKPSRARGES